MGHGEWRSFICTKVLQYRTVANSNCDHGRRRTLPEAVRKGFTEEATSRLDLKRQVWLEGADMPRKEKTARKSERSWFPWGMRKKPHLVEGQVCEGRQVGGARFSLGHMWDGV